MLLPFPGTAGDQWAPSAFVHLDGTPSHSQPSLAAPEEAASSGRGCAPAMECTYEFMKHFRVFGNSRGCVNMLFIIHQQ